MYNQNIYNSPSGQYVPNGYQVPMQQRFQIPPQVSSLIRVTGIDGARAYQMPPNSVVPLFDNDNDIMYIKSTDGAGFPTIKAFSFVPYEDIQPRVNNEYVTREEFEKLKEMIENGKQFVPETTKQSIKKSNSNDSTI